MADKAQAKKQLIEKMAQVLKKAVPEVDQDIYQDFILKFANSLLSMLETYLEGIRYNKAAAERNYTDLENQLIVEFLQTVPLAMGGTQEARALLETSLNRVLEKADLGLSAGNISALFDQFDSAFIGYAVYKKLGNTEEADKTYSAYEDRITTVFNLTLSRAKSIKAQERLKERISSVLEIAHPEMEDFQKSKVQDQLLWLFSDYIKAPEAEREKIYSLGEDRIIFSLLDSMNRRKGERKSENEHRFTAGSAHG